MFKLAMIIYGVCFVITVVVLGVLLWKFVKLSHEELSDKEYEYKSRQYWTYIGLCAFVIVVVLCLSLFTAIKHNASDSGKKDVIIYDTSDNYISAGDATTETEETKTNNEVVMITEDTTELNTLSSCDELVNCLFSGSSYSISVNKDIVDKIKSSVGAVSPDGGYIARQSNIQYSGITSEDEEGSIGYIAVVDVYCLDMNNSSYSYDVVIRLEMDAEGVVTDFNLYMFK